MISAYIVLTKPRIILLLLVTALGGLFLATEGIPELWLSMTVLLGGSLAAGGANSINHYLDRDIDAKMTRTSNRPVATGSIKPIYALSFGILLNVVGFSLLWQFANLISAILVISATLFYVFVYTMGLKRTTPQNIVIGGAAGSIPPMAGWAAVTGNILDPAPFFLFAIVFFWTPPHFWALSLLLKDDYAEAGIPMLPVVSGVDNTKRQIFIYTWLLLALVVATTFVINDLHLIYGVTSILLTIVFIGMAWRLTKQNGIEFAKPTYLFSLAYLGLIFIAVMIDSVITF
ncbi:MAG: heme o synthase [SAR202 cluster bacterium]|jgi:protoheme IX farnesyltransferase|nr:heme o synthase [SAR202 cluster bacterium]